MFRRIAIPLVAGIAVVLWLALAGTPAFAQPGHGMSHYGHEHTNHYGAAYPPYWRGSFSYPSYHSTPYYSYDAFQYGKYGGTCVYWPDVYHSLGYGRGNWRGRGCW